MKKISLAALFVAILLSGCAHEFNQVYKSDNYPYKYEYAKECFAAGKYTRAATLLGELVTVMKGTENAQECLYMYAMAEYCMRDYQTASEYFKKYYSSYPRGQYAEMAKYYVGESLYMSTPEPRLDQSQTYSAISAYQEYLDLFPDGKLKQQAQQAGAFCHAAHEEQIRTGQDECGGETDGALSGRAGRVLRIP